MALVDFQTIKNDGSGDWNEFDNPYFARIDNLMKMNKFQLKFFPDGLNVINWIKDGIQYPVDGFVYWLTKELLRRDIPVSEIGNELDKSTGGLNLTFKVQGIKDSLLVNTTLQVEEKING